MKLNKIILGLGALGLMLTGCDSAADQTYTPAPGVAAPPAYFAMGEKETTIVLEENQTSFSVPIYRATTDGAQTVQISCDASANVAGNLNVPSSVTFADGQDVGEILVTYDWEYMKNHGGEEYTMTFKVAGEDTPYFITSINVVASYVPWVPVVGPNGGTQSYFVDALFYSGWGVDASIEYPVEIQYIEGIKKYEGIYRILTPYANCPHIGGENQGIYTGGDMVNIMYINASDPNNVYLCDKDGAPQLSYDTYYTMDTEYGNVSYWDRVSGDLLGTDFEYNAKTYPNSRGNEALCGTYDAVNNCIVFPEEHFYAYFSGIATDGNELIILLPDGKKPADFAELGVGTIEDFFISWFDGLDEPTTYDVTIEQSLKDPNIIRLVNPYTNSWPDGNDQDDDYPIDIDLTDANFVTIAYQSTGYTVEYQRNDFLADLLNAGYFNTNQLLKDQVVMSKDEVIEAGLNDTFEDNVINIAHPMAFLWEDESNLYVVPAYEDGAYLKVTLPQEATGMPSYATKAVKNKTHKRVDATRKNNAFSGETLQRNYKHVLPLNAKVRMR